MTPKTFILVGENNLKEAQIFNMALSQLHEIGFHVLFDGDEVIDYLRGEGKYTDRLGYPFPTWLVLNFQLPTRSGLDVVQWIRKHPDCGVIPVLLFSNEPTPEETKKAYELGVNTVFKKPQTTAAMSEAIVTLGNYWSKAEIPETPANRKCA